MDEAATRSWMVAPEILLELRLQKARDALAGGDADRALVEAEELLESNPDHLDALRVSGAAALQMGDATAAMEAYERALQLRPQDAETHAGLAMARFGVADLKGALSAAHAATRLRPDLPDGWYYQALAYERLGNEVEAAVAFCRAQNLDPQGYPVSEDPTERVWDAALAQACFVLHPAVREFYSSVQVRWERFPSLEELLAVEPPLSPFTDALYEGTPPVDGDPWAERPTAIRLFRGNLGRPKATINELGTRIARAMLHEALDWLGVSYEELESGEAFANPGEFTDPGDEP